MDNLTKTQFWSIPCVRTLYYMQCERTFKWERNKSEHVLQMILQQIERVQRRDKGEIPRNWEWKQGVKKTNKHSILKFTVNIMYISVTHDKCCGFNYNKQITVVRHIARIKCKWLEKSRWRIYSKCIVHSLTVVKTIQMDTQTHSIAWLKFKFQWLGVGCRFYSIL